MTAPPPAPSCAPRSLTLAVPVAPPDTVADLKHEVDHLVCRAQPGLFYAIGAFYENFEQIDDDEVVRMMAAALRRRRTRPLPLLPRAGS